MTKLDIKNPQDDTPPFDQWIFIDFGEFMTFGRVLQISPNDESTRSEYADYKQGKDKYEDYQFYVQLMHTRKELSITNIYHNYHSGYFDSDFADYYSDSIEAWAVKPY